MCAKGRGHGHLRSGQCFAHGISNPVKTFFDLQHGRAFKALFDGVVDVSSVIHRTPQRKEEKRKDIHASI